MKNVFQEDKNGCWLACASMITGVPYSDLESRFKFRGEVTGRAAGPLVKLLDELGYECNAKSTRLKDQARLTELNSDALVYFKNVDDEGDETGGHWMVWDSKEAVIRDPEGWLAQSCFRLKNFRRVSKRA